MALLLMKLCVVKEQVSFGIKIEIKNEDSFLREREKEEIKVIIPVTLDFSKIKGIDKKNGPIPLEHKL